MTVDASDLRSELEALSKEEAREAANRWFSASQEALYEGGDEHDYDVSSVAQSAMPPQWDDGLGGYAFEYLHMATRFFNEGTAAHEVEAQQAEFLAFEWPEGGDIVLNEETGETVREAFEDTFPTVFFPATSVEGITALRFFEDGQQDAEAYLEGQE